VKNEPCGFLGNAECAGNLTGRNTVLRIDDKPDSRNPDVKTEWAVFDDGTDFNTELPFATLTLLDPAGRDEGDFRTTATRAGNAVRPAHIGSELVAYLRVREVADYFD
jgi:hypothetical protein